MLGWQGVKGVRRQRLCECRSPRRRQLHCCCFKCANLCFLHKRVMKVSPQLHMWHINNARTEQQDSALVKQLGSRRGFWFETAVRCMDATNLFCLSLLLLGCAALLPHACHSPHPITALVLATCFTQPPPPPSRAVAYALLATQAVKAQLERQRDLDGIDVSNIVGNEGRRPRRAAAAAASVAAR